MTVTSSLMDDYIASTTPAVMVPRSRKLPKLEVAGHRYLVARQGLYLEVRRDWIHAILPMSLSSVELPFGDGPAAPELSLLCGRIPRALLAEFAALAHAGLPNEIAAWVLWHRESGEFKLLSLVALQASDSLVHYARPELDPGWQLVLDLHSHPVWPASFSTQDDEDDGASGEVKLCGVLGFVSTTPQWRFRLAAGGLFHQLEGAFE